MFTRLKDIMFSFINAEYLWLFFLVCENEIIWFVSQIVYIDQLFPPPYAAVFISLFHPTLLISLNPAKMDEFCIPRTQIPERLYRVQHDKSFINDIEAGLVASDTQTFTEDIEEFALAVRYHINDYKTNSNTMYISTFASKAQAEDWMCRKWRLYGKGAQILEIETSRLGHGYVYRAGEVAHTLRVGVAQTTYQDLYNEYLILHSVPARAIIARRARMMTHGLENKDSVDPAGNDSSDATPLERASPVPTFQPYLSPLARNMARLLQTPRRSLIRGESQFSGTPRGSTSARGSSQGSLSPGSPFID